jgi:hypothetical protein
VRFNTVERYPQIVDIVEEIQLPRRESVSVKSSTPSREFRSRSAVRGSTPRQFIAVWLLVAALTTTFNLRLNVKTTADARNEVTLMNCGEVKTTEEKSETTIEVAATSHAARTGLPT